MSDIQPGQIWRMNLPKEPKFIKCFEEQEDKYVFMPVYSVNINIIDYHTGEIVPSSKMWNICSKTLIHVYKDRLDFFLERTTLEEQISAENN